MAYGNYNNQNQKNDYSPTVYSPYRMNNGASTVDATCITYQFWNSTMKVGIYPRKQTNNDDMQFDMQAGIGVYLNHTKARMFHEIVKKFRQDPVAYNECGVDAGKGLITINNGSKFGTTNPCIVIRTIDESGAITGEFVYEMKGNEYYYGIYNYDTESNSFQKNFADFSEIELDQLETVLSQYYTAMTMATAFTIIDQSKYENQRLTNKIEAIGNKLGVEFNRGGGSRQQRGSYFANSEPGNTSNFTPGSLADLDED